MDPDAVLAEWQHRSGEFSPAYYAHYGPDETSERVRAALSDAVGTEASVLELGCGCGRHLAHLHDGGYRDLSGVDVNADARETLADAYPALADAGTFYFDAIEAVVPEFGDRQFDAVYSVETLQHVHHENEWVFEEVARVTDDALITVELEGEDRPPADHPVRYVDGEFPLYYRDWERVFTELGFEAVASEPLGDDTFRLFRRESR